jgi:hypothetical protein
MSGRPPVIAYGKPDDGPPPKDTRSKEQREAEKKQAQQDVKRYQDDLKDSLAKMKK